MPKLPKDVEFTTNNEYLWTNTNPDLDLVEPPIVCSINKNYLKFGHTVSRPPLSHIVTIVNHGEFPVAFKVLCTDNYVYFVNQKYGVIPGRSLHAMPHIRMANAFHLEVFRRPYDCIAEREAATYFNLPKKDRMFIQLTPAYSHTVAPAAFFHPCTAYEKLRICVEFTGSASVPGDKGLLYRKAKGWCTWDTKKDDFNDEKAPELVNPTEQARKNAPWVFTEGTQTDHEKGKKEEKSRKSQKEKSKKSKKEKSLKSKKEKSQKSKKEKSQKSKKEKSRKEKSRKSAKEKSKKGDKKKADMLPVEKTLEEEEKKPQKVKKPIVAVPPQSQKVVKPPPTPVQPKPTPVIPPTPAPQKVVPAIPPSQKVVKPAAAAARPIVVTQPKVIPQKSQKEVKPVVVAKQPNSKETTKTSGGKEEPSKGAKTTQETKEPLSTDRASKEGGKPKQPPSGPKTQQTKKTSKEGIPSMTVMLPAKGAGPTSMWAMPKRK